MLEVQTAFVCVCCLPVDMCCLSKDSGPLSSLCVRMVPFQMSQLLKVKKLHTTHSELWGETTGIGFCAHLNTEIWIHKTLLIEISPQLSTTACLMAHSITLAWKIYLPNNQSSLLIAVLVKCGSPVNLLHCHQFLCTIFFSASAPN